jgi:excisionase family DNA binding protein
MRRLEANEAGKLETCERRHRHQPHSVRRTGEGKVAPIAYTVIEACEVSRTSRSALYEALKRGELAAKKRGRRTLILDQDLRQWLKSLPPKPCSAHAAA